MGINFLTFEIQVYLAWALIKRGEKKKTNGIFGSLKFSLAKKVNADSLVIVEIGKGI